MSESTEGRRSTELNRRRIKNEMVLYHLQSQRFVPDKALSELVHEDAVLAVLQRQKELTIDPRTLTRFICNRAPKLFTILVWMKEIKMIEHAYKNGFTDAMLPVTEESTQGPISIQSVTADFHKLRIAKDTFNDHIWDEIALDDFRDREQWQVLSPVFRKNQFRYKFHECCRMPFLENKSKDNPKVSNFSVVEEWRIHRDHLQTQNGIGFPSTADEHPSIALKEIMRSDLKDVDFRKTVENEIETLERLRRLNHPHLIKAIAYCALGARHLVLFPWAGMGNLRDFWKMEPPKLDKRYLKWAFTQLCGLADGIEKLHNSGEDSMMRHGDLKPENVLCFESTGDFTKEPEGPCILVIADVGLTKNHHLVTEQRKEKTRTQSGTIMYEPPEIEFEGKRNIPRSRRYDIWSMGCIYLEFVIWLLYGAQELERFRDDLGEERRFYSKRDVQNKPLDAPILHIMVQKWVDWIIDDPRCPEDTSLRHLVELIVTRLLVTNIGKVRKLGRVDSIIHDPQSSHSWNESPPQSPTIIRTSTSNTYFGYSDDELDHRATAMEMNEKMSQILKDAKSSKIKWMKFDAPVKRGPGQFAHTLAPSNAAMAVPPSARDHENEYRFTPLSDKWEYTPDTDIADEVITGEDPRRISKHVRRPSELCQRCSALDLWRPRCGFYDTIVSMKKKSWNCALCELLFRQMEKWKIVSHRSIQFFRVGSNLVCSERLEQPIASLFTVPGSNINSFGIQIGMPKLPDPGSEMHTKILASWIRDCDQKHRCLPAKEDFLPTRVLDVGSTDSPTMRLVCCTQGGTSIGRYLALSHRWGSATQRRMCTLMSNIEQFKRNIEVTELPQTFLNAVEVTRSLGLRFLWIDSFCIVQDDPEDWDYESRLMEQVFSSAYATISATCAGGSDDGFLKPRPERHCVTMTNDARSLYYVCDAIDNFHEDVDQAALNRRGWVLQERALSRRTIHLTEKQSYWECGEGVRCETLTKMTNRKASFLGDSNFPHSVEAYVKGMKIKLFQDLFERYSNLDLTYTADRPIAIRGLERRLLHTLNTGGGYGIFNIYLHRCLLWKRAVPALKRIPDSRGASIPSWSWMAYEGRIQYMDIPFGKVEWAEGIISPFGLGVAELEEHMQVSRTIHVPARDLVDGLDRQLVLDDPLRDTPQPLKCVVVGTSKQLEGQPHVIYTLLITQTSSKNSDTYERVGVAVLEQEHIAFDRTSVNVYVS